jgi:hypothetical protein
VCNFCGQGSKSRHKGNSTFLVHTLCTALQKGHTSEPMSITACLLNPNEIPELIMNSDSNESQCDVVATEDEQCCEEVLLEPHL